MRETLRRILPYTLLLAMPLVLTGCFKRGDDCATVGVKLPDVQFQYTVDDHSCPYEECLDTEILGEHGTPYQHRRNQLIDDSCFAPYTDEGYDQYFDRMMRTMMAQQQEIARLERSIASKRDSIGNLDVQLAELETQHADLRVALANWEAEESERVATGALFSRYIVQPGDTLQKIAYDRYNTHQGWLNIFRFNIHKLPNGPNQIEKGQALLIPKTLDEMDSKTL